MRRRPGIVAAKVGTAPDGGHTAARGFGAGKPRPQSHRDNPAALGLSLYMSRRFDEALAAYDAGLRIAIERVR